METAFSLHRFYDDGGNAGRFDVCPEQQLQGAQTIFDGGALLGHGEGQMIYFPGQGPEGPFVGQHLAREGHGQHCAAVECPAECYNSRSPRGRAGNFHRIFHSLGTGRE